MINFKKKPNKDDKVARGKMNYTRITNSQYCCSIEASFGLYELFKSSFQDLGNPEEGFSNGR